VAARGARKRVRATGNVTTIPAATPRRRRLTAVPDDGGPASDVRLAGLDDAMLYCRSLRHSWVTEYDVVTRHRGTRILEIRRRYRCDHGCKTYRMELINVHTWEQVRKPWYEYDPRYKLAGERVDARALRREFFTRTSTILRGGRRVDAS